MDQPRQTDSSTLLDNSTSGGMLRIVESNARARCSDATARPQIAPTAPSPLLSRLSAFIPQLQAANEHLQDTTTTVTGAGLDMEVIPQAAAPSSSDDSSSDSDASEAPDEPIGHPCKPHIEMDIACGVLDLKDAAACEAAETAAANGQSLDDEAAASARLPQKGLVLPGGEVLSPPTGSPKESSSSGDDEQPADILEVSTTRFPSATGQGHQESNSKVAADDTPAESVLSPTCEDVAVKRQKITVL